MARHVLLTCCCICVVLAEAFEATQASALQDNAVRVPLNHYFKGHATGDSSHMRSAFLPTAHIEGVQDGKVVSWTLDEYCSRFTGKPADDESSRRRTIDSIDVSGDAAMARATLIHGAVTFTDYFILLKVGDEWRIANKVYVAQTRGDQNETSSDGVAADALLQEVIAIVSGPGGERDWDRLRTRFVVGAAMLGVRREPTGQTRVRTQDLDAWIQGARKYLQDNSLYERVVSREVTQQPGALHLLVTLESRRSPDSAPYQRTTNALMLIMVGGHWRILSWTVLEETPLNSPFQHDALRIYLDQAPFVSSPESTSASSS